MRYYLVGIKGSAMSALAKLLVNDGHIVCGVDVEENFYTCKGLENIEIFNFDDANLQSSYFYIIGNAYINSKIYNTIINNNFYFKLYPDFLKYYYANKKWICVSGSHGKTTTTKLLSHIIGSTSLIGNGEFCNKNGDYFILEACEYKDTFLNYNPDISLILNVDYDHPDYFKTSEDYYKSFMKFVSQSKISIINNDSFKYTNENVITYGKTDADLVYQYDLDSVYINNIPFKLPVLGDGFRVDFVGAYLVCKLLNFNDKFISEKLKTFKLPKRRMDTFLLGKKVVICDYAHHPTEIISVYNCLKETYPNKKLTVIFEPHTFSRFNQYLKEFKESLSLFDECYLTGIFSSCREKMDKSLEKTLYEQMDFSYYDLNVKLSGEVIVFMGAGRIDKICQEYLNKYKYFFL